MNSYEVGEVVLPFVLVFRPFEVKRMKIKPAFELIGLSNYKHT